MSANPDSGWIYAYVDVTAAIINAGDPIQIPVPSSVSSWEGTWEFLTTNAKRTAGAAAATWNPKINEANSSDSSFIVVDMGNGLAIANAANKAGLQNVVTVPKGGVGPNFYPTPNLGGDTFRLRALVRKRQ